MYQLLKNIKQNGIRYVGLLIIYSFASSCSEDINFDLNDENTKIVIDAFFTTEQKEHIIKVNKTTSYYARSGAGTGVSGARVEVTDGAQTFVFNETEPGIYKSGAGVKGENNKTYTVTVAFDGQVYTASSYIHPLNHADTIVAIQLFDTIPILNEVDSGYSLYIAVQEPPEPGNFYLWKYYINDKLETDTVREFAFTDDGFVNGTYVIAPIYIIKHQKVRSGDIIRLETYSINKEYNDFLFTILLQTDFRGGIFDGPAANVKGNFSNGALGFFMACDVDKKETRIP